MVRLKGWHVCKSQRVQCDKFIVIHFYLPLIIVYIENALLCWEDTLMSRYYVNWNKTVYGMRFDAHFPTDSNFLPGISHSRKKCHCQMGSGICGDWVQKELWYVLGGESSHQREGSEEISRSGKGFSVDQASDPTPAERPLFEVVLTAQMTDDTYQALRLYTLKQTRECQREKKCQTCSCREQE